MNNQKYYSKLLKHPYWFAKRKEILARDNNSCRNCFVSVNLNVHHLQYHYSESQKSMVAPWQYDNQYLITLCVRCHELGHKIFKKIPTFKIN